VLGLDSDDTDPDLDVLGGRIIHGALDDYNNHGSINGIINAHDAEDSSFLIALSIAMVSSADLFS
jgi:hypothetical protein